MDHHKSLQLGLLRQRDFLGLWVAQIVSNAGSGVSSIAIPLTGVLVLAATPTEMGGLRASATAPALLLSLFVGVWVDRLPRRPILVAADLGRAVLLTLIPVGAVLGMLRIEVLYLVSFMAGTLTLFFDIAITSYLPSLVRREELVEANAKLQMGGRGAEVAGPGAAGWLVQTIGAPFAIVVDALSFLSSAVFIWRISADEQPFRPIRDRRSTWHEIGEGIHVVWDDIVLRVIILVTVIGSLAGSIQAAIYVLYVIRDLRITPTVLGFIFATGGASSVAGAAVSGIVARRAGPGPAQLLGQMVIVASAAALPLAAINPRATVSLLVLAQVLFGFGMTLFSVNQISLRQAVTQPNLLGRVNATRRVVVFGIQPIGAILGGLLGLAIGLQTTLDVVLTLHLVSFIAGVLSPLRTLREQPLMAG